MLEPNQDPDAPSIIAARIEPDSLTFETPDGSRILFLDPRLNQTPAQSAAILKLRALFGPSLMLRDDRGVVRATFRFDTDGDVLITTFDADGRLVWAAPVSAEHVVPDTPAPLPKRRRWYRWIAVAFTLFLFILTAFIVITPTAGSNFVERAGIGFVVAVAASIFVLQIVRGRQRL